MNCPICAKPMQEQKQFLGLWVCPDGKTPLNDAPPFRYKCNGMVLTDEGSESFSDEITKLICQSN